MTPEQLQHIIEAAIMVAGRPLSPADLQKLFNENEQPSVNDIRKILQSIEQRFVNSGIELCELASGFQFQAKIELSPWLSQLWEERPPRYSRALLETLALIAYRQPITRAEIEEIRGVAVSSQTIKTLQEREWIRVIAYRDVPGKPALYATTKNFLDHFNLKNLDELPTLAELKDLDSQEEKLQVQLELAAANTLEDSNGEEMQDANDPSEKLPEEVVNSENLTEADLEDFSEDAQTEKELLVPSSENPSENTQNETEISSSLSESA